MGGVSEQADDDDGIMKGPIREQCYDVIIKGSIRGYENIPIKVPIIKQGYDDVIMNKQSESRVL